AADRIDITHRSLTLAKLAGNFVVAGQKHSRDRAGVSRLRRRVNIRESSCRAESRKEFSGRSFSASEPEPLADDNRPGIDRKKQKKDQDCPSDRARSKQCFLEPGTLNCRGLNQRSGDAERYRQCRFSLFDACKLNSRMWVFECQTTPSRVVR